MVKATLVGPDISLGEEVLRRLDAAKFPVSAALWLLNEDEYGGWRLIIGTPNYEKEGRHPYRRFRMALDAGDPGFFAKADSVFLASNRSPLIKGLRAKYGKFPNVEGMRLGGHSIGDFWIDDAYVYRIR
jgi:hypothetical protein